MENLSPIVEKVIGKARSEAALIIQDAEKAAAGIIAEAEVKASKNEADILAAAKAKGEEELRRTKVTASLEARNEVLKAKGKLIQEVLSDLPAKLHSLNSRDYTNLIRGFALSVAPLGLVHVITAEADKEIFNSSFVMGLNQALLTRGQDTTLILTGETTDAGGGLLLKSDTISVDCSLDSICAYFKDELEPIISTALFSD